MNADKLIQALVESQPKLSKLDVKLSPEGRIALCQYLYDNAPSGIYTTRLPRSAEGFFDIWATLEKASGSFVVLDDATLNSDLIFAPKGTALEKALRAATQAAVADPLDPDLLETLVDALISLAADDDHISDVMIDQPGNAVRIRRALVARIDSHLLPNLDNSTQMRDAWHKLSALHKAAIITDVAEALAS